MFYLKQLRTAFQVHATLAQCLSAAFCVCFIVHLSAAFYIQHFISSALFSAAFYIQQFISSAAFQRSILYPAFYIQHFISVVAKHFVSLLDSSDVTATFYIQANECRNLNLNFKKSSVGWSFRSCKSELIYSFSSPGFSLFCSRVVPDVS